MYYYSKYDLQWFYFRKYKSWYWQPGFKATFIDRKEMLHMRMNCSRGSGIFSSGGVIKNSFSAHLLVTVVFLIILGMLQV